MQKLLIWGTGIAYDKCIALIKYYEREKQFSVVGVTSNDTYFHTLDGYPMIPKEKLTDADWDWILVCASDRVVPEIRKEAVSLGISEDVILSSHILSIPGFDFEKYTQLVQSKLTILTNNCWGGVVYQQLGLKVRSPLYNMAFDDEGGYIRFLKNAKDILMNERLEFEQNGYNEVSKHFYPIYLLAGIRLRMLHDCDRDKVERKWYERISRMNWENVFVMMYTDDLKYIEEFSRLPYEKKVCFTSMDVDIPSAYTLPLDKVCPGRPLWEIVIHSAQGQYKLYDLMDMVMTGCPRNSRIR